MEDEIDLRKYIILLVSKWKWIAGISILFALVGILYSKFYLSPTYEAKAILFIVQPQSTITLDSKFTTQTRTDLLYYSPIDQLAVADELVQALQDAWTEAGNSPMSTQGLKGMMEVADSSSVNSIELMITSHDPKTSGELANLWAKILIQKTDEIYTDKATQSDTILEQFNQIETEREAAQQALVDFQAQNKLLILQSELTVTQTIYSDFLVAQAEIKQSLQDIESLQTQLDGLSIDDEISFDIELTTLLLQLRSYNLDQTIQIDINTQPLTSTWTVRDMKTHLEQLQDVLTQRDEQIALELEPLQSKILALQSEMVALETTQKELTQDYTVAADTYLILDRKLNETKISNQVTPSSVRLASVAMTPENPSGPNTLFNTLIAGVFGLFLTVSVIFGQSIWKEMSPQPKQAN